jgi:hypothetical protein
MASERMRNAVRAFYRARFAVARPRDFVLTGIPRSGTSLLSTLLCEPADCFCFNEIKYDPKTLPLFLDRMRHRLVRGRPVPVKVGDDGALATDTMGGRVRVSETAFPPKPRGVVLGSNVNVPYLDRIDTILAYGYRIVTVVRDPVFTLASWASARSDAIPEAHVSDDDMHPRWRGFRFRSDRRDERQAELWEHYAAIVHGLGERAYPVRYEDLCADQDRTLAGICGYLGVATSQGGMRLRNQNDESRFGSLQRIRAIVAERCPTAEKLGYEGGAVAAWPGEERGR